MPALKSAVVSLFVLASSLAVAQPEGEVVIQSRDGKAHLGRIISETSKGYLLATATGTEVIEFASIADIRQLAPVVAPAPSVAARPAPRPASSPAEWSQVPPPPPEAPPAQLEAPVVAPQRSRRGAHLGLGLNTALALGGSLSNSLDAEVQGSLDVNLGRVGYRLNLGLGGSSRFRAPVTVNVDNLFTLALGDVFAMGAGLQLGLLFGGDAMFQASPLLQPAILRLGERGQHQLAATLAYCVLGTVSGDSYPATGTWLPYSYAGTLRVNLGYTFLF